MTVQRKLAWGYAAVLLAVASINYLPLPGLVDAEGLAFGIFALDPFDDALHVVSALWAGWSAWRSHKAAEFFLIAFGLLYLADGALGMLTGWGYLDLAICFNASIGADFGLFRWLANLPHMALGGLALAAGLTSLVRETRPA
ncbi:MAG: hypothetical protein WBA67_09335 [Jannaschia sp.]